VGGTGKTALVSHWLQDLGKDAAWGGAESVFAWSFFSHGPATDRRISSDPFISEAFKFFGVPARDKGRTLASAIRHQRTLLVLDGLESLQESPNSSGRAGQLRDDRALAPLAGSHLFFRTFGAIC